MASADETYVTEISIAADGRIYVFGASQQVIELLGDLQLGDPALDRRVRHTVVPADSAVAAATPTNGSSRSNDDSRDVCCEAAFGNDQSDPIDSHGDDR